jgi:4-hydroxythreonine-4-phosphate dehydrogenase
MKKIIITTGDLDGIGLEVSVKALSRLGPQAKTCFILWRGPKISPRLKSQLGRRFKVTTATSLAEALTLKKVSPKDLIEIVSSTSPALWVEESARACYEKRADALVTAPLSKPEIFRAGLKDIGHTEILKRVTGKKTAVMSFWGKHFRVLLATGHLPLSQVEEKLSPATLDKVLALALQARAKLPAALSRKPVGVLGLNPHAGDKGLIGDFEEKTLIPWIEKQRSAGLGLEGPLVPDAAFHQSSWSKYSFYIALYHDQGLIPFKALHGFSGVHVTLGLPLVRSSVDHGTAKDLFGKNKADPSSMIDAVKWALQLTRR